MKKLKAIVETYWRYMESRTNFKQWWLAVATSVIAAAVIIFAVVGTLVVAGVIDLNKELSGAESQSLQLLYYQERTAFAPIDKARALFEKDLRASPAWESWSKRRAALSKALNAACTAHGIDPKDCVATPPEFKELTVRETNGIAAP